MLLYSSMTPATTLAIAGLLGALPLGQARAAALMTPRSMSEDQAKSFYIDVHDMPDIVKEVAIPKEKGRCNLLLQYLDLEGYLFPDDGPKGVLTKVSMKCVALCKSHTTQAPLLDRIPSASKRA